MTIDETPESVLVTREQQADLDIFLGQAYLMGGAEYADLIMVAYKLGRQHEREVP